MTRLLVCVAALALCAPAAFAQTARMTDQDYLRASRCLAYNDIAALQSDGYNTTALRQALDRAYPSDIARSVSNSQRRNIRAAGVRARDRAEAVAELRTRRDQTCAGFVATGLVQAGAPAAQAS